MAKKRGGDHGGGGGHDGAGGMRWLLTYADLITLLLIMFIMLYSISMVDAAKFKEIMQNLKAAFGGVLQQGPTFLPGSGDRLIAELVPKLSAAVENEGSGTGAAQVFKNERGIVVRLMTDNVLYDRGSVELKPEMQRILDAVAPVLGTAGLPVLVEGHTDDLPTRGRGRFQSNWELSTERATQVVRYLIEHGKVPPARLSAAGYAEFHPLVPNDTEAGRRRNRRIDIIILNGPASSPAVPEASRAGAPIAAPAVTSAPPVPGAAPMTAPAIPSAPPIPAAPPMAPTVAPKSPPPPPAPSSAPPAPPMM